MIGVAVAFSLLAAAVDPVLALADEATVSQPVFRDLVARAVARHPALAEARAVRDEAAGARDEARAARYPAADLSVTSYNVLGRAFSNDPDNLIERTRANSRTDLIAGIGQTVMDFGATSRRIAAAGARLRAAATQVEGSGTQVALGTIAAWYDVFTYRALAGLAERRVTAERALGGDVRTRIASGVSAEADAIRVDSAVAATQARLAGYRRLAAAAEARFAELAGSPAPATLGRVPPARSTIASADMARMAAAQTPEVRAAKAAAEGARADARAAKADLLPVLSAGIDAGRYGFLEDRRDYDVRARVILRQRLSLALPARARQIDARAAQADARAARIAEEAGRDAAIAWADAAALGVQADALADAYRAAARSRDMLVERFRAARGSLLDVLAADDAAFGAAAAYVEVLGERDAAGYALLARTGGLLDAVGIAVERVR